MTLKYTGDCSGDYDRARGTGLVGKVIGPTQRGFVIVTEAVYDAELNVTLAKTEPVMHPARRLAEMQEAGA